jgi:glycosyltransferase involved in cell wall biosynthesis
MHFTVIIATRNRAALVRRAVESVLRQSSSDWDMVLVNDGSDDEHLAGLAALDRMLGDRARRIDLPRRVAGHGPSHALNAGAAVARGDYLCFLDDDDEWIDDDHLVRLARVIAGQPAPPDLLLANQHAWRGGAEVPGAVWIEDLLARAVPTLAADATGAYRATAAQLLRATGFAHVNTITIRRDFFAHLGGFDESLRYEGDRDFYLRAIDQATTILHLPEVVARHNIPDPAMRTNMSTIFSGLEKRLFQLRLLDKAILFSRQPALRRYARRHKTYILKHIAMESAAMGAHRAALFYALEAASAGFTLRWTGYTLFLLLRRLLRPE